MKNQRFYICCYCFKDYEPKRRRAQKYCSNTCRSKAYHSRKKLEKKSIVKTSNDSTIPTLHKPKQDAMSVAGVGNAVAGVIAVNLVKNLMTKSVNKPATKGDINSILEKLQGRYHVVKNIPNDGFGRSPYYDMLTNAVIYM